jgi:RND family efflux transporter MFP subunit
MPVPARQILTVSTLLILTACARTPEASAPTPSLTVSLVQPTTQTIVREVPASGVVTAWEEIQIGAALAGVRVEAVLVEVGDSVKKGDVLVRLDARIATAQLAQAEAAVSEARASLDLAVARAKRTKALAAEALVPAQDVDDVVAGEARARAQLDTTEAARRSAQLQVEFAVVVAPENGVVASRTVQPGQMVGGTDLLRLIRDGRLEWRAELDEQDLLRVAVGASATVEAADGAAVTGRVRRIAPGLDQSRRTGTVFVELPRPGALRAGTFAAGRILVGTGTALTVPAEAVVRRDGRAYVFLVDADHRARERLVELGSSVGDAVEVRQGLAAGESVVARGAGFLNDGDLVRESTEPAAAPSDGSGA